MSLSLFPSPFFLIKVIYESKFIAACANEAFKIATNCVTYLNNYMMYTGDAGVYTYTFPLEKNESCQVCGTATIKVDFDSSATLQELIDSLMDRQELYVIIS